MKCTIVVIILMDAAIIIIIIIIVCIHPAPEPVACINKKIK